MKSLYYTCLCVYWNEMGLPGQNLVILLKVSDLRRAVQDLDEREMREKMKKEEKKRVKGKIGKNKIKQYMLTSNLDGRSELKQCQS